MKQIEYLCDEQTIKAIDKDAKQNGVSLACWVSDAVSLFYGFKPVEHISGYRGSPTAGRIRFQMREHEISRLKELSKMKQMTKRDILHLAVLAGLK